MDTLDRLKRLLSARGWTEYQLSKECGLAQSTIGNIFRRNTVPSLATLETICSKGFGISLGQFFADDDFIELTPDLKEIFDYWVLLSPSQRETARQVMKTMAEE